MNRGKNCVLGFTLVEVIIVIALFTTIVAFSYPLVKSYNTRQLLDGVSDELYSSVRRIQGKAMAGDQEARWGIHWGVEEYTIFSGDDYDARDTSLDLVIEYPGSITIIPSISGSAPYTTDLIFNELTGETDTTGTITVNNSTGESKIYSISSRGQIERQ